METRWENIEDNDYDEKPLLKTLLSELSERLKSGDMKYLWIGQYSVEIS